jgi:hypothetical protein
VQLLVLPEQARVLEEPLPQVQVRVLQVQVRQRVRSQQGALLLEPEPQRETNQVLWVQQWWFVDAGVPGLRVADVPVLPLAGVLVLRLAGALRLVGDALRSAAAD